MGKSVAAIICAAGFSRRFGGRKKKPFAQVGGRAAFLRSVELFTGHADVKQTLLAIAPEDDEYVKVTYGPNLKFFGVGICHGGAERFETVARALEKVKEGIEMVAVHDAARCCITREWIDQCFEAASASGAAVPACPVSDTIKKVGGGKVLQTIDRSDLWEAQTPQVFETALLKRAYSQIGRLDACGISDDAQLVEALGVEVSIVQTDPSNMKITVASDIAVAEAIIKSRPAPGPKGGGPVGPYYEAQW